MNGSQLQSQVKKNYRNIWQTAVLKNMLHDNFSACVFKVIPYADFTVHKLQLYQAI